MPTKTLNLFYHCFSIFFTVKPVAPLHYLSLCNYLSAWPDSDAHGAKILPNYYYFTSISAKAISNMTTRWKTEISPRFHIAMLIAQCLWITTALLLVFLINYPDRYS